ncbi:MAG TPA: phage terminase large subunit [Rhizomicrobium sp.]|nr:phage terminase large subunit [Rhizomicrobium sp.]
MSVPIVNPGAEVSLSWHIKALTHALQKMQSPGHTRLVVNLPPRTLKSTIVSVCFVAWLLGHDPSLKIICVSYEDSLARKFSRDTRTLMESDFYQRLFPGTRLNPRKTTETEFETTAGGYRFATSVGGSLTGRGADYLIIDDPIKPQDADSEVVRTRNNEWVDKTAMSRQEHLGTSRILVVQQRLHADDLSGMLIEKGWPHLVIPAIATERRRYSVGGGKFYNRPKGELLQPGRDRPQDYEDLKRQHGSRMFEAQYQQNPTPHEGNLIRREWLKRYESKNPYRYKRVVLTCDPAAKPGEQNDYTAIAVAGEYEKTLHLLDMVRGHWTIRQMAARIVELAARWNVNLVIVEDTASGPGLIQDLRRETKLNVIGKHSKDDKQTRLLRQQGTFEAARILFPGEAPWLAEFERELLGFPSARYDDQVDAILLLLEWFATAQQQQQGIVLTGPYIMTAPRDPFASGRRW